MTDEEVINRLGVLKGRTGAVELPKGCNCITCGEFKTMGKMGLFTFRDLSYCIEVTLKPGAEDINSLFALEIWKLNHANPTEV